jgi:ubiquinone/menaquinone biosynthesis C-methylase UbiE
MADVQRAYVPAAGSDWSLPLYDPIVKLMGGDAVRRLLLEQAAVQPGHNVLEVGCGTGTLLMLLLRAQPAALATGLDPDPKALARARRKADAARVPIQLDRGFSDALPYRDASFDRVFSCFMLHHLHDAGEKIGALAEIRRVLKPGGSVHLLDFARPASQGMLAQWLHSHHRLEHNTDAQVLSFMREAGLAEPTIVKRGKLLVLGLSYYRAVTPGGWAV